MPKLLVPYIFINLFGHMSLAGGRVSSSLYGLDHHASEWVIGLLIGLFSLLPMFTALHIGKLNDRLGPYPITLAGLWCVVVGGLIPVIYLSIPSLFATVILVGFGFSLLSVPAQNTIGELAGDDATKRVTYLGWYSLGHAVSSVVSPVIVGYCIDHYGFRSAYVFQFVTACLALLILLYHKKLFQAQQPKKKLNGEIAKQGIRSLLTSPGIKRIYVVSLLFSIVWDLYTFLVPILGKKIGLSATAIGTVVSSFAIGIMFVRLIMPLLAKRFNEWEILRASMITVVVVYAGLPWATAAWQLMFGGFFLGCALGCSQPNMLSLLHQASPPGRAGEAVGLRMSFGSASSVFVPLVFGLSASSFGLLPVFWLMAAAFAGALPQVHKQVYKNKD